MPSSLLGLRARRCRVLPVQFDHDEVMADLSSFLVNNPTL
jgi:hypothetical protein